MAELETRRMTAGAVLIAVGLAFYVLQRVEGLGGEIVLGVLGLAFLVGYLWRRAYPLLVPAGLLLGLTAGIYLDDVLAPRVEGVLLGLGCGFLFIWLVSLVYERRNVWWPLFPGAALVLFSFPVTKAWAERLFENWPLLLVAVGVLLVIAGLVRSRRRPVAAPPAERPAGSPPPE
ncbi:MAG TPA: hypothetical protein VF150_03530 [Thermoanaerobaculia bacterium]